MSFQLRHEAEGRSGMVNAIEVHRVGQAKALVNGESLSDRADAELVMDIDLAAMQLLLGEPGSGDSVESDARDLSSAIEDGSHGS